MNSLLRLVGENLSSTTATDLAHKKAIILDTTSGRELKEMDLSNPTFETVQCNTLTCSGNSSITGQLTTGNITSSGNISCQNSISFLKKVSIVGYARLSFNGTPVGRDTTIYSNGTWYTSDSKVSGILIGPWSTLTLKWAGDKYIQFPTPTSSSASNFNTNPYLIIFTGIKTSVESDGNDSNYRSKQFTPYENSITHRIELQCTISVEDVIKTEASSGMSNYDGTLYMYLLGGHDNTVT